VDVVSDLSHLPSVRFQAASYDEVSRHLAAWKLLFRARPVLRARGHVSLGGGRHVLLNYGRVLVRRRSYMTVEGPGPENVVVPTKRGPNLRAVSFTVGPT
jgi:hypothetical protein